MTDNQNLLPVVQKFFEYDLDTAAHILESMTEEAAVHWRQTRSFRSSWAACCP